MPLYFPLDDHYYYALFVPLKGCAKYLAFIYSQSLLTTTSLAIKGDYRNIDQIIVVLKPKPSVWIKSVEHIITTTSVVSIPPRFECLIEPNTLVCLVENDSSIILYGDISKHEGQLAYLLHYQRVLLPQFLSEKNLLKIIQKSSITELKIMALQANLIEYKHPFSYTCHLLYDKKDQSYEKTLNRLTELKCHTCQNDRFRAFNHISKELIHIIPKSNFNPLQCIGIEFVSSPPPPPNLKYYTTCQGKLKPWDIHICCLLYFLLLEVEHIFCLWPPRDVYQKHLKLTRNTRNDYQILRSFLGVLWLNDFKLVNLIIR